MKLALVGAGRMNGMVKALAQDAGHQVVVELDDRNNAGGVGLTAEALADADVAVDFSVPGAVLTNIERTLATGTPMVVGTTGWYDELARVEALAAQSGTGLVYGANFSIGANVLLVLADHATRLLGGLEEYDPYVVEHHHRHKKDVPSGTALRLAEAILAAHPRKSHLIAGNPDGVIPPDGLQVASVRAGEAFGVHCVGFDSAAETVELTHTARGREAFARGALTAAAWVRGRTGCHEFSAIFRDIEID